MDGAIGGPVRFWTEHDRDAGWAWAEEPTWLELCIDAGDPHATDVAREAVAWFLAEAPDDVPARTMVLDDEHLLLEVLAEADFLPEDGPFFVHHHLDLERIPPVRDVPCFRLKPVRACDATPRAACHRVAWSSPEHPSRVTTTSYAAVMATPPYRPDLDWVAVAADGAWVASCLVWLDTATGVALVEPVGCAPEHRRRGLAAAVSLAALRAARDAGATRALVCPRGDRAYPGPMALYQGLGFEPGERTVTLVREP
ncbi:hypothetical protein BH09ACT12_BH09ACT12_32530 [soil metagenome]